MNEWTKYRSHKTVTATPIVRIDRLGFGTMPKLFVLDPDGTEQFHPTEPNMASRAKVGDYAMIYRDGFQSLCPRKEFEDGYSAVREAP